MFEGCIDLVEQGEQIAIVSLPVAVRLAGLRERVVGVCEYYTQDAWVKRQ